MITCKNDAIDAKIVNARLTKIFIAIFAPDERLPSSATLDDGEVIMDDDGVDQGSRTWQPFVRSKNGNENFRQARFYNFRVKCVVFVRNRKFAKLTQ